MPLATYTLSREEKVVNCNCLHEVKVSEGYYSNFRYLVSSKDFKLRGLKPYHCHIMMEHLLSIRICSIFTAKVRHAIIVSSSSGQFVVK